jgi:hypothetical protein
MMKYWRFRVWDLRGLLQFQLKRASAWELCKALQSLSPLQMMLKITIA